MFSNSFVAVILASFTACGITTTGIYVISRYEQWSKKHSVYFKSFAAGVLISVSFTHIIPNSFQMNRMAPVSLLIGFLALYLFNRFLKLYLHHENKQMNYTIGFIPVIGIGLHSFIDGIIYSVTFNVSIFTGILAAIGMVLHEFPEGIITFVLLNQGNINRKKSVLYAFLAAALSTPLGALVSYPFINNIKQSILGIMLAISAGALVYVGASHLLPEVEKENRRESIIALGAGVLIAFIIIMSKDG